MCVCVCVVRMEGGGVRVEGGGLLSRQDASLTQLLHKSNKVLVLAERKDGALNRSDDWRQRKPLRKENTY